MKKRLVVVLLRVAGAPDQPSKAYVEKLFTVAGKGTRNLIDYFDEMSHGRLNLDSVVFDWVDYGHTKQDLLDEANNEKDATKKARLEAGDSEADAEAAANLAAHRKYRGTLKVWAAEAAATIDIGLARTFEKRPNDIMVYVFNRPMDYFGGDGVAVLNWDPVNGHRNSSIELTGASHEIGHGFGLPHSRSEGSPAEYGDAWDIMSAYTAWVDTTGTLTPPGSPYFTFGPGMNAVNMEIMGWLDTKRVFTPTQSTPVIELRPLHQRSLPGWLALKLTLDETIYVEFRMNDGWDVQIPEPCVLLHRSILHPDSGRPCSELVLTKPAPSAAAVTFGGVSSGPHALLEGEAFETGNANDPFDTFVRLTVTRIDTQNRRALLHFFIREPKRIRPPQAITFGGVRAGGGGLVWTPGRGFVKVPPRSPLLRVFEDLGEFLTLQTLETSERPELIEQLSLARLARARDGLTRVIEARTEPQVPGPPLSPQSTESDEAEAY